MYQNRGLGKLQASAERSSLQNPMDSIRECSALDGLWRAVTEFTFARGSSSGQRRRGALGEGGTRGTSRRARV